MTDLLTSTSHATFTSVFTNCVLNGMSHSIFMYFITEDFISNQSIVINRDCRFIWWLHSHKVSCWKYQCITL